MIIKRSFYEAIKKIDMQNTAQKFRWRCRQTWKYTVEISKRIIQNKEVLSYYTLIVIVLIALGAATYDYRMKKASSIDQELPPSNPGIQVQSQPIPTLSILETETKFILPIHGEIAQDYSDSELLWSTTLQLWQTHPAIDISASPGEAVAACADGKVVEMYRDALYGNTIVVDHGDGLLIYYRSLNTLELVEVGQTVTLGEIIGSIGTCTAESSLGAHIHLECIRNGINLDFRDLLSEMENHNLQD